MSHTSVVKHKQSYKLIATEESFWPISFLTEHNPRLVKHQILSIVADYALHLTRELSEPYVR